MARIAVNPLIEELVGKLGGSVFQDSYGGMQVRTRVSPRNPQTKYQQLRRGEFAFLSSGWRNLSDAQRQTFIDAASTPPAGFNLYLSSNINLTLIEVDTIVSYPADSVPGEMTIEFGEVTPSSMPIIATGGTTTVPANRKLLIQVTDQAAPTRIFTNPSMYTPVISFDEGTDLSTETDIITEWTARYGVLSADRRLCLKANLISKLNGLRGADSISCTNSVDMANTYIPLQVQTAPVATTGTSFEALFSYTMPANTLLTVGDRIRILTKFKCSGAITSRQMEWEIAGNAAVDFFPTQSATFSCEVEMMLTASGTFKVVGRLLGLSDNGELTTDQSWSITTTVSNDIIFYGLSDSAGDITAIFQSIDLIKAP